ncbi:hypothetical protein NQ317_005130 [Molorchus minor]|uniref:UDP-glycosyltransferases domain-containing protein n=1 Tax=Molorchus minor TaxID=1323400 RepID=A0ABQ9JSB4_9CUCU|nr:hypothetical protein NQ317_005130 [Molorchus minor]
MKLNILPALMLFGVLCSVKCGRILGIFPFASRSHYILGNSLMKGLAEAGHNVTVISPFEDTSPPKRGSYSNVVLTGFYEDLAEMLDKMDMFKMGQQSPITRIFLQSMMLSISSKTLEHTNVQNLLKSDAEFDVIILEQFMTDALKIFGHIFRAPLILFHSMGPSPWVNEVVGNPSPLAYIPHASKKLFSKYAFFPKSGQCIKLLPLVPNMIEIGGYHVKPPKKLPKDLQEYLDSAKEGVVYFSMGSNLKSKDMPPERKDMFLNIFRKLKQKVLWKFEDENLPGQPTNVKIEKWLPQQDILAHPNVKVFITHGGLLSTTETVYHGVPILAIPVFGDQPQNARRATNNGYGLSLSYDDPDFSEEKLSNLLNELLTNPQSHYILGNSLMKGLAEAGHNVTVISPFEDTNPPKRGSYSNVVLTGFYEDFVETHFLPYHKTFRNPLSQQDNAHVAKVTLDYFEHSHIVLLPRPPRSLDTSPIEHVWDIKELLGKMNMFKMGQQSPITRIFLQSMMLSMNSKTLEHTNVQNLLNSDAEFDVIILEQFMTDALKIFGHMFRAPLIIFNSIGPYLQEYLDSAKEGVVYFSMGSNLKSKDMPPERKDMFLNIFRKLKQKVLWKFEDENLPRQPTNVKIEKWLPQQDILAHPNVKVFITHGGLLSTTETVYHGVPILAIPVFGDQPQNARRATNNGYGLSLSYHDPDFSEEKLSNLLNELLTNPQYRENVKKRSKIFHDRPLKPMENAVYWVEYVIRHGGAPHLRVAGVDLPWYKYHLLDVIAFILGVTVIILALLIVGIRYLLVRKKDLKTNHKHKTN